MIFACRWCPLLGAERAGRERLALPPDFRLIPVECAGAVSLDLILRAFADGAHGVAVMGCHLGGCRHNEANRSAHTRLRMLAAALEAVGISPARLFVSWGTVHEARQFAGILSDFQIRIRALREEKDLPLLRGQFTPGHDQGMRP
ncbi:MAG: hydrogenase iron-sulfur subunit [Desulfovibrio sp.]|nr:hydrogenase iron-sulfur subunit [Desulfovibrio sp.]